ncbi:MAG TPA: serine/threonine-protein kinase [Polyangia bacterium]|jgi:serine/threonine-protein kinase|nr:serine/threonine-protein kinase [Polyangia bacterium]
MDPRLAPGVRFGKYEIVRLLGEGGMGLVYEALHVDLKKRVAIKTLNTALAAVPEATVRFRREGEAAARIRHPNVVDVTDVGIEAGVPYLVMEYLEGQTLGHYLQGKGPLTVAETADFALPIIAAVAAGHEAGVIHRDLKPANIFLVHDRTYRESVPKVLDFGVSKLADAQGPEQQALTRTGAHLGTICYMSPEQALGAKRADARSDQYALGLILYECVTGRRAYRDDDDNTFALLRRIGDNQFEPPLRVRPELPPAFADLLLRALAHQMKDRFESMSALGAAMLPFGSARAALLWERTFKRHTVPAMDVVATDSERPGARARGVAPTMPLGLGVAAASTERAKEHARDERPAAGGTQLLATDPRNAAPESPSTSGLAFEAVPVSARRSLIARRWPAALAIALAVGGAAAAVRGLGSSSPHVLPAPAPAAPLGAAAAAAPAAAGLSPTPAAPEAPARIAPPAAAEPAPVAPRSATVTPAGASHEVVHHAHAHKSTVVPVKATVPAAPRVGANNAKIME